MFPETNFFHWLIIAPKATKTQAVAFVCNKSNVYLIRKEEWLSMAAFQNGRTDEACALSFQCLMWGLSSLEKRWCVLTSCDWNKGCSRSWKERRLELKLYIFDQFCAWLTKFRKILLQNLQAFVTGFCMYFQTVELVTRRSWLM